LKRKTCSGKKPRKKQDKGWSGREGSNLRPSPENIKKLFAYLDSKYTPELALRNKAIIAIFVESGLRLFGLSSIKPEDIDFSERTIRVWGKGRKGGKAPFGQTSEVLLREWLSQNSPNGGNIWGVDRAGIQVMLKRLHQATGITCKSPQLQTSPCMYIKKSWSRHYEQQRPWQMGKLRDGTEIYTHSDFSG
jgi:site-specific recombinase XerC